MELRNELGKFDGARKDDAIFNSLLFQLTLFLTGRE